MTAPFCDALTVSLPVDAWSVVRGAVVPELDGLGMAVEVDRDRLSLWRSPDGGGVVRSEVVAGVRTLSVSGSVCVGLRAANRWGSYLSALGAVPHRVTRLDATADVHVDAPPVIDQAASLARLGGVSLTRKAVRPRDVTTLLSVRGDGALSGTVYMGGRRASVRLCLYDKRKERMDKGLPDIGPLTRYEIRLGSAVGATLRDAHDPTAIFWQFMPSELLKAPAGVPVWSPLGEGFEVDRPEPLTPAERLYRRLQDSAEFAALVSLAAEFPGGLDMLLAKTRTAHAQVAASRGAGVPPAETAVAEPAWL